MTDMRKYAGNTFLKVDDVHDGPRREKIAAVSIGKYDRPVLDFEAGDKLTLNATNTKTMIRNYGADNRGWLGHVVELYLGEAEYEGETKPSVKVRPVSLPEHYGEVAEALEQDTPPAGSSENPADGMF